MMLLRQFCLGNNLPTHIRENTDFPLQKPQQLLSAKANFEGCLIFDSKLFFNVVIQPPDQPKSLSIKFRQV